MHRHDACRLTLTSPWEARIEESTYLAYVFCELGRLRSSGAPHNRRRRTRQVGLVTLLTAGKEGTHHRLQGPLRIWGEPSWQPLSRLSPRTVRGRSLSQVRELGNLRCRHRGVGSWKLDCWYVAGGHGRPVYRPP